MSYAQGTQVSSSRSLDELQRLLVKHGATQFVQGWDSSRHRVMFELSGRTYRFEVAQVAAGEMASTPTGRSRDRSTAARMAEEETARRMRSLLLVIKALFIGVEDGILDIHTALLPWTVLPSGSTVGEWAAPQLDDAYQGREMPTLIPGASS